jgi:hypothetical protein
MRFTIEGSRITCSRIDNTIGGKKKYRDVVEFDSHVDVVPPHVAAKLTRREIGELEGFLADRKRIQGSPAEVNMLEALPEIICEATDILDSAGRLNNTLYRTLYRSVSNLADALDRVKPKRGGRVMPIRSMRDSEALKERLEKIKRDI